MITEIIEEKFMNDDYRKSISGKCRKKQVQNFLFMFLKDGIQPFVGFEIKRLDP